MPRDDTVFVPSGRYRATEVRALVENYVHELDKRDTDARGLRSIVRVADLKRAWRYLNSDERRVLLAVGVLGVSTREAGEALQKSQSWVTRRYKLALEELTWLMNGGPE